MCLDLNAQLGARPGDCEDERCAQGSARMGATGEGFLRLLEAHAILATSTFVDSGPTFFSGRGPGTRIDYICCSGNLQPSVLRCRVSHRIGRRLQVIPDSQPRDHFPIILDLAVGERRAQGVRSALDRIDWDADRMACALQKGEKKQEFLEALAEAFRSAEPALAHALEQPTVDSYWEQGLSIVRRTAGRFFSKGKKGFGRRPMESGAGLTVASARGSTGAPGASTSAGRTGWRA